MTEKVIKRQEMDNTMNLRRRIGIMKSGLGLIKLTKNWDTLLLAYTGLIKRYEVLVECRNGAKFFVKPKGAGLSIAVDVLYKNVYEFPKRKLGVVVDIGAHVGIFSLHAAKYAERVLAFEPEPENFSFLERNIELNSLHNVAPYPYAVAKREGERELYLCKDNTGAHSLIPRSGAESLKVQTTTLKSIFEASQVDKISFLKMDCEGCEYEVLSNLPREYFDRIEEIGLEAHSGYEEIIEILGSNKFRVDVPKRTPGRDYMIHALR